MGDVVRDPAYAFDEFFELRQHSVELGRELANVVARRPRRHASRQIAGHHFAHHVVDGADAPQPAAAHDESPRECERDGEREPPSERSNEPRAEDTQLVQVAADEQVKVSGQ